MIDQVLSNAISARGAKNGLHITSGHIEYVVDELFYPVGNRGAVLYVGIGHGQDAIMALMNANVRTITGIDPYKTNVHEYVDLLSLIKKYELEGFFNLHKTSLEEYLSNLTPKTKFDSIVCCDVLHHIFATGTLVLRDSLVYIRALETFKKLRSVGNNLIVSDVQRHGLRPFLAKYGILKTGVNYQKKQDWQEWNHVITEAGWKLKEKKTYVPFALRNYKSMLNNELAQHTICDRYFLYYESGNY